MHCSHSVRTYRFRRFAEKAAPSNTFTVSGEVKSPAIFRGADLRKFMVFEIGDLVITNHLGEKKSQATRLQGVLLKDVLSTVEIKAESPRVLSEYFFVCKANDGYTGVYSWNELFNTDVGNTSYLVTSKDGLNVEQMDDAILMVSASDHKTGRRHLKALVSIDVQRAR